MPLRKIQLIIRDAGLASRRRAEVLIREGHVTLNGKVVLDPSLAADTQQDHVKVDGKLVRPDGAPKVYYLFNKPRNVVSTFSDPEGRPSIGDLLLPLKKKVFLVGRLDFDAEGLVILTNDGALAQKLSHPSHAVPRTYLVKVRGKPDEEALSKVRRGLDIGDGDRIGEVRWAVIRRQKTSTWIRIVIFEGKKNEIKRIFARIDHPVRKIKRVGFGPLSLGKLPVGHWRSLTSAEMETLRSIA